MNYRVLALDLDGTLTNSQKEITPATLTALQKAMDKGVKVLLASGRPAVGVWPLAWQLELDKRGGYILAYHGGQIIDCATGCTLFQQQVPRQVVAPLCAFARENGIVALTYNERGVVTECPEDPYVQLECRINHVPAIGVKDLAEEVTYPVTKFLLTGEGDYLAGLVPVAQERFKGVLNIFRSEPFFMEATPPGIEKGAALERLLNQLGLKREQLMACGDGLNDMPMLQYAGLSVAMANAQPEAKAAADAITLSNDEDGVAAAVEQYLLNE